jgi:potassium/hydrogen antiporter
VDADLNTGVLIGCLVLLAAVLAVRVARSTGLPALLLYLLLGMAIGESGLGIRFEDYALTADLGLLALAVVLAEGGLTTRWSMVRPVLPFALVLSTLGVAVSVAVVASLAHVLLGADWRTAVILGGVVSSTDAAAVFSVLRRLPLRGRLSAVLEAESGFNDAPVVVLVVLASSASWGNSSPLADAGLVLYELVAGAAVGLLVASAGRLLLARVALASAGLYPLATVALALLAFTAATAAHASGFLAVYLAALVLGNARLPHRRAVLGFTSSLALLAEAGLFILLGLLSSPSRLPSALLDALVVGAAATLLARPLAVALSSLPFRVPWRQQVLLSWAGLRGAVPIVVATIPVTSGVPGAERVLDVVVVLVVVYTLLQAPTLPLLARRLGLVDRGLATDLEVESAPLEDLRADLLQLRVPNDSPMRGTYVDALRLPSGAQVVLVVRAGTSSVPGPDTRLAAGDSLLVVTTDKARDAAEARLLAVLRGGALARWYGRS